MEMVIKKIKNRVLVNRFLINSLPKGGTNLFSKAIRLFPGISFSGLHIGKDTLGSQANVKTHQAMIPIGVDSPASIDLETIKEKFSNLKAGHFATAHIPYSSELSNFLLEAKIKSILIFRDPRDVVVSHAFYVSKESNHFLFDSYQPMSIEERITCSIVGTDQMNIKDLGLLNIQERCQSILDWKQQPLNYTTQFERIIGEKGGGSRELQFQELRNIAHHLGIEYSERDLEHISKELFGGTHTFRKGTIGSWRENFSERHKSVFKDIAGQTLIDMGYETDLDW